MRFEFDMNGIDILCQNNNVYEQFVCIECIVVLQSTMSFLVQNDFRHFLREKKMFDAFFRHNKFLLHIFDQSD